MTSLFIQLLEMSKTASFVILFVLFVRLLLTKAPKKYSYYLWSIVGFRLICPISFDSFFSIFNLSSLITPKIDSNSAVHHFIQQSKPQYIVDTITDINKVQASGNVQFPLHDVNLYNLMSFWFVVIMVIIVYLVASYFDTREKMQTAIKLKDNIYQLENITSPFVYGYIKPKIIIPYGLDEQTLSVVIHHEQYHIKRKDHFIKLFSYLLVFIHWFNPLVWLAFRLMNKDMEMSCDEYVLSNNYKNKKEYSYALLSIASNSKFLIPKPLSFNESAVKSRIKNVLDWKKPDKKKSLIAIILCVFSLFALSSNPMNQKISDVIGKDSLKEFEKITVENLYTANQEWYYYYELDNWLFIEQFDEKINVINIGYIPVDFSNEEIETIITLTNENDQVTTLKFNVDYDKCMIEVDGNVNTYEVKNKDLAKYICEVKLNSLSYYANWYDEDNFYEGGHISLTEKFNKYEFGWDDYAFIQIGQNREVYLYEKCDYIIDDEMLILIDRDNIGNKYVFNILKRNGEIILKFNEESSICSSEELIEILNTIEFDGNYR